MESESKSWYDWLSNKPSTKKHKTSWVIVSWVHGKSFIHTNILNPDCFNNNEGRSSFTNIKKIDSHSSRFIDISKQAFKLSSLEIYLLSLNSINTNKDIISEYTENADI